MNIKSFNAEQKQALLDLAMLAMYVDGHLAIAEDERVNRLLDAIGFASDYDRTSYYDASISRVSRHSQTAEAARLHAMSLAHSFKTREQRQQAQAIVNEIITSDADVAPNEKSFLMVVREALQS